MLITPLGTKVFVRYARKAIWMPTAPSKLFRIAEHTFYDDEELKQIKKLDYAYKSQMRSIGRYMEKEFYIPATQAGGMPLDFIEQEKVQEEALYKENDRINAIVSEQKKKYFDQLVKDMEDKTIELKLEIEEALIESGQRMDEYVKKTKCQPDSFVTHQNIEAMLETALDNPINLEYYIDRRGRRYPSSNTNKEQAERQ